jgi:hypothetical protein
MGYCMNQTEAQFTIKKKNIEPALKALKDHFTETGDCSWIYSKEIINAQTFKEAMKACRWHVGGAGGSFGAAERAVEVDIEEIYFEGEKSGNDATIFNVIAPYVESGSYIQMVGEDNSQWRWIFDGKACTEISGEVDFEGNREIVKAILKQKKILLTLIGIHPGLDVKIRQVLSRKVALKR